MLSIILPVPTGSSRTISLLALGSICSMSLFPYESLYHYTIRPLALVQPEMGQWAATVDMAGNFEERYRLRTAFGE